MKNRMGCRMLVILSSALVCVIAGLLAFLYFDFRADRTAEASRRMIAETELYRAAENLADELRDGRTILAYHDAKEAAESARLTGQERAALLFDRIARELEDLSDHTLPASEEESVRRFLETGEVEEGTVSAAASYDVREDADEPRILSQIRLERARKCADRLIGTGKLLHLCEKNREGQLLFTCANAYAVIDEATGLPVEAALSFSPGAPRLTTEECAARAQAFLTAFYPKDIASAAVMCSIEPAARDQVMRAQFFSLGRRITVDVRRDTGRVTGLRT